MLLTSFCKGFCHRGPKLPSCISQFLQPLPDTTRSKPSFVIHFLPFPQIRPLRQSNHIQSIITLRLLLICHVIFIPIFLILRKRIRRRLHILLAVAALLRATAGTIQRGIQLPNSLRQNSLFVFGESTIGRRNCRTLSFLILLHGSDPEIANSHRRSVIAHFQNYSVDLDGPENGQHVPSYDVISGLKSVFEGALVDVHFVTVHLFEEGAFVLRGTRGMSDGKSGSDIGGGGWQLVDERGLRFVAVVLFFI
mmetsp:Transcript_4266/g.9511  ORF Transcript_4266/g.9511 Transcript_4266/m.9511 type:complete len:251 (+) Transcript_4266:1231-1983(+)